MKNKDLNLSIPSPCNQPWEEMTASGNDGRYCSHCQKTVIDFTTWSDASLHKFLWDKREKVWPLPGHSIEQAPIHTTAAT
ncbi:MAG: hypothetical protein KF744_12915 [Taibaiella sp.]|nr:hypothetical protein [Taibaiella sp.]